MKRDITKSIEEYNKKFGGNTGNGAFYATDLMQIKETAEGKTRGDREFVLISNALRAGLYDWIPQRAGGREEKRGCTTREFTVTSAISAAIKDSATREAVSEAVGRFIAGDWGNVPQDDKEAKRRRSEGRIRAV